MRLTVLIATALSLAACGQAPMGSTEAAAPPADAPTTIAPDYSGDFDALGTEPFWSVKVRATGLTLSRPDHPDVLASGASRKVEGETGVFDAMGDSQRLVLRLTPGECSDGMSDRRYAYFAEVRVGEHLLKGCAARPRDLAARPRP